MDRLHTRFPIYSKVMKLYPEKYQKEYSAQILQTTADMLDNEPSYISKLVIWARLVFDLPVNIARQQFQYSGGFYMKEAPSYIKRNSFVSILLLLPFFVTLGANGIDRLVNHQTLYHSWLWKYPWGIWVLYLPEVVFLLALGTYIVFLSNSNQQQPNNLPSL